MNKNHSIAKRERRHKKIRSTISGTQERPRLCVAKSNTAVSAQLINDVLGTTLAAASTKNVKGENLVAKAKAVGLLIAEKAKAAGITAVVFDRGGYVYTGKVAAVAEGAREGGLNF